MKTLEEITRLSEEELEMIASDASVPVPEGLQERIRMSLAAQELLRESAEKKKRPSRWVPATALALASLAAAFILLPQRGPKDTFDDPLLAYAEVEKTFQTISGKMNAGIGIAREASAAAEIPQNVLNKIQTK